MGDIIGGTFVQHFDKKGKPTTTDDTVLGVTYKNETQQQFAERLQSANYLAVLDKMGLGASKFVAALQGDADKLFAAVQDFAQTTQNIQINLGKGFQFLALGANETIVSVMKFVQGLQASGETLTQTYARLLQAQQQYNQFVAQFKPATVYVDPFEGSLAKLFDAMVAARKQANDLAIAAGASGASTEDLTNIQKAYAAQMAQLTIQLEASAQSLAFSLGLTTQGSLDQINQEIARLQGQIKARHHQRSELRSGDSARVAAGDRSNEPAARQPISAQRSTEAAGGSERSAGGYGYQGTGAADRTQSVREQRSVYATVQHGLAYGRRRSYTDRWWRQ
jgi:hypothetical protein